MYFFHLLCHYLTRNLACELSNSKHYHDFLSCPCLPVFGILCDGNTFEVFSFNRNSNPKVSRGTFLVPTSDGPQWNNRLVIANLHSQSSNEFIHSLQPICETFFYILLQAHKNIVKVHAINEAHARERPESTDWSEAYLSVTQALTYAMSAAKKAAACKPGADKNGPKGLRQFG